MSALRPRRDLVILAVACLILFSGIAVLYTYPLVTSLSRNYFSPEVSGDGVATIADTWYRNYARNNGLSINHTKLYGYPFGFDSEAAPLPLAHIALVQLARLVGPQASFNILMLLTFPLAGLFMFLLIFYVTKNYAASLLGGFIYAFMPWHTARMFNQLTLACVFYLPLFVLALLFFWRRRNLLSAFILMGVSIATMLTDFHLGLFCCLLAAAWAAAAWIGYRRGLTGQSGDVEGRGFGRTAGKFALLALLVIVVSAVATGPYLTRLSKEDPAVIPGFEERDTSDTVDFSAQPWCYVVPPLYSYTWGRVTDSFVSERLGRRQSSEVTCYPGIVTYGLAIFALIAIYRRKKPDRDSGDSAASSRVVENADRMDGCGMADSAEFMWTATSFALISAVVAFILSMPPIVKVGGASIPTPSIVMRALAPPFRYYCRWGLVVAFALSMLAAIGFVKLVQLLHWRGWKPWAACLALLAVFCIDVAIVPPWRSKDIARPPAVLAALARSPREKPVSIYPLAQGLESVTFQYKYYQQFHLHPMLNGVKTATEGDLYRLAVKDIYSPYTARMLRALGIEQAVVMSDYYADDKLGNPPYGVPFDPERMPAGYKMTAETADGYIYDIVAEPADVFPLYYANFTSPGLMKDGVAWSAMTRPRGRILLVNKGKKGIYNLTVTINNPGPAAMLRIKLEGDLIGEVELPSGTVKLSIPPLPLKTGRSFLELEWSGKPVEMSGEPFRSTDTVPVYLLFSRPEFD